MGWLVDTTICPNCEDPNAEKRLRNNLEEKEIECKKCGYYKEFIRSDEWISTSD